MQKNKITFSILIFFLINNILVSQTLSWEEVKADDNYFNKNDIPEGKSLLIFETPVDLTFESSVEPNIKPYKKEGKYFLFVDKGAQVITFNYIEDYFINFGQKMDENTLPSLNSQEIKYFKISEKKELEYYNITEKEKQKGNITVPIGPNVSDAAIIFNVFPPDLPIEISSEDNAITKLKSRNGSYIVFLQAPKSHVLKIKTLGFDITSITIDNLEAKEIRFYYIRKPLVIDNHQYKEISVEEINNKKDEDTIDLNKLVIGNWGGSLGLEKVFLIIESINDNSVSGKILKNGIYSKIKGIITVNSEKKIYFTLDKSASKYSLEKGTLDFVLNMGIGSGIWISDDGKVEDFNIMRVKNIPAETNFQVSEFIKPLIYESVNEKAYFYSSPNIKDKTSKYIVKSQNINISNSIDDFYHGTFTYNNLTTSGYLLKTDLKLINSPIDNFSKPITSFTKNDLIGKWICDSSKGKIIFDIQYIYDGRKLDGQIIYSSDTIPLEGTVKISKDGIFSLLIPEDPEAIKEYIEYTQEFEDQNGIFKINIKDDSIASGIWESLNRKKKNSIKSFKKIKK